MNIHLSSKIRFFILLTFFITIGCQRIDNLFTEKELRGTSIEISDLPETFLTAEERAQLPPQTKIEKCNDGNLYRLYYPDGKIYFHDVNGKKIGVVI